MTSSDGDGPGGATWSLRQAELLDQLGDLLAVEGFRTLTVGELADRLRCSRRTLYTLAASRNELVALALARLLDGRLAAARRAAAAASAAEAPVVLLMVNVVRPPASAAFVEHLGEEPAMAARYAEYRVASLATLREWLTGAGGGPAAAVGLFAEALDAAAMRLHDLHHRPQAPIDLEAAAMVLRRLVGAWSG